VVGKRGKHAAVNKTVLLPQAVLYHQAGFAQALGHFFQPNVEIANEVCAIKDLFDIFAA
jgi:hypothetical protein